MVCGQCARLNTRISCSQLNLNFLFLFPRFEFIKEVEQVYTDVDVLAIIISQICTK